MLPALAQPKRIVVCQSQNFQVDYSINPWMKPGTSDSQRAIRQWQEMVSVISKLGVKLVRVEFPDDAPQELIWTRDAFQLIHGQIVLANFRHAVRRAETPFYRQWFEENGYKTITAEATFEGGNTISHAGVYYVGTGFRAEVSDCEQLARQLDIEVVALEVTDNTFFHIDLALISIDQDNVFYFPPAFTPAAQQTLQSRIPGLHELSESEMQGYCSNSVAIGNNVIIQSGNSSFKTKLEHLGKTVHEVDVSEFKNIGGGGIHCLTNVLE